MVEMHPMAQFVDQQVLDQGGIEKQQAVIQADSAVHRAATPAGFLPTYLGLAIINPRFLCSPLQPGNKVLAPAARKPAAQQRAGPGGMLVRDWQLQCPVFVKPAAAPAFGTIVYRPGFLYGAQVYVLGQGKVNHRLVSEVAASALYPVPAGCDEGLYVRRACPERGDDFHLTAGMHVDRQIACTRTGAYKKIACRSTGKNVELGAQSCASDESEKRLISAP